MNTAIKTELQLHKNSDFRNNSDFTRSYLLEAHFDLQLPPHAAISVATGTFPCRWSKGPGTGRKQVHFGNQKPSQMHATTNHHIPGQPLCALWPASLQGQGAVGERGSEQLSGRKGCSAPHIISKVVNQPPGRKLVTLNYRQCSSSARAQGKRPKSQQAILPVARCVASGNHSKSPWL